MEHMTGKVLIRTVTMYYTGEVESIYPDYVRLKDAAWISDTGRFGEALKTGVLSEVEPYPGFVNVTRGAIVDWCAWDHDLPRAPK